MIAHMELGVVDVDGFDPSVDASFRGAASTVRGRGIRCGEHFALCLSRLAA